MRRHITAGVLLLSATAVLAVPSTAAAADISTPLPMTAVLDLVVDDARNHVFLTGGGSNGVVVRAFDGTAVKTINGQPGANGMALSSDGSTLYVALSSGDAISAIDTTTLTETARYATGAGTCPTYVAAVDTSLWFGYGCSAADANIGTIDISGDPVITLARSPVALTAAPMVLAAAAEPTRLVATPGGTLLYSFTVSDGALELAASRDTSLNIFEIALTPDGQHVVAAGAGENEHRRYRTSDLSSDGAYSVGSYPSGVSISANGYIAAGVYGPYDPDIYVFSAAGALRRHYELNICCATNDVHELVGRGIAISADASLLFAVSSTDYHGLYLHVLHDPAKSTSSIVFTRPAPPRVKSTFTISGTVTGTIPVAPGSVVHVARSSVYGSVPLPDVTTGTNGSFSIVDTVAKRGVYTYTASWQGDADHTPATKALTLRVYGLTPSVSIAASASAFQYAATARVTARLGVTAGNRKLLVYATPLDGSNRTLANGPVDGDGYLRGSMSMSRTTTFTAYFSGDEVYEPRKVTKTVRVYARVTQRISGHYGTSNGYYLFRRSVDPTVTAVVVPVVHGCVDFVAQRRTSSGWQTVARSTCISIYSDNTAIAKFVVSPAAGAVYRVRSTFTGNMYNLAVTSSYGYLKFT